MGAYTHPPMNSYNVEIFNFMNTHPPIKHIQSVTLTLHILWRVHGVGGGGVVGVFMGLVVVGWVVGGFMGWVGVWWWGAWWGGWLESSWVGEYTHPPHLGVLGAMGRWVWA